MLFVVIINLFIGFLYVCGGIINDFVLELCVLWIVNLLDVYL